MNSTSVRLTLGLTATLLGTVAQSAHAAAVDAAPGFFISTLPFTDTGTTIGMVNDINSLPSGVNTYTQVSGPDVFYTFTVAVGGTLSITVTPTGNTSFDPAIYLLAGSPVGTSGVPGAGRDTKGPNEAETTSLTVNPGTYYLVIDSFYSAGALSAGAYQLEIAGTAQIVPEPGSAALAMAAAGTAAWRRRRRGAR